MQITLFRRVLLCSVGIAFVLALALSLHGIITDVPVMSDLTTLPAIILDPGHGGADGGAVGAGDTVEKDINLAICLALRDMLAVNGFEVILTRETDISIHDEGVKGIKKQKTSDLHNRMKISEKHPGAIFISIHQNKFGDSRSNGTQVFYGPLNPESERLAEITQAAFVRNLQPQNHRVHKKAGKNLYLMYESKNTAILIECGFLSNADECRKLRDPEYQSQIAFTAFSAVMEYLELNARDIIQTPREG